MSSKRKIELSAARPTNRKTLDLDMKIHVMSLTIGRGVKVNVIPQELHLFHSCQKMYFMKTLQIDNQRIQQCLQNDNGLSNWKVKEIY